VGCYGGMSIAAGLCSYLIMTREARLGLNGPAVIEQEAGIDEFDSRDKPFIWSLTGGEQRFQSGLVDAYVADDIEEVRMAMRTLRARGIPSSHRSDLFENYIAHLSRIDTGAPATAEIVRHLYAKGLES